MILFIYFLERGEGREKEKERNINVREIHQLVAAYMARTGHLARKPGMCPDWESNLRPFGSQANTQSTELHQPGRIKAVILFLGLYPQDLVTSHKTHLLIPFSWKVFNIRILGVIWTFRPQHSFIKLQLCVQKQGCNQTKHILWKILYFQRKLRATALSITC